MQLLTTSKLDFPTHLISFIRCTSAGSRHHCVGPLTTTTPLDSATQLMRWMMACRQSSCLPAASTLRVASLADTSLPFWAARTEGRAKGTGAGCERGAEVAVCGVTCASQGWPLPAGHCRRALGQGEHMHMHMRAFAQPGQPWPQGYRFPTTIGTCAATAARTHLPACRCTCAPCPSCAR
jgi:hypothetical protein